MELKNLPYGEWLMTKQASSLICDLNRPPKANQYSQPEALMLEAPVAMKPTLLPLNQTHRIKPPTL